MPSPDKPVNRHLARLLLGMELRNLLAAPALWLMLIITSLLVGFSFIQAVELYSQASRTARAFPALAAGMNPQEGIFLPTFGAYYLVETLLLPFVAIRVLARDKLDGTLKLTLQLPVTPTALCAVKLGALLLVWLLNLLPAVSAMICWHHMGGHLHGPAISGLLAGHTLYFFTVSALGLMAAALSNSQPAAAMLCLAVTLGSWVLDFAAATGPEIVRQLARFSPGAILRQFENGLVPLGAGIVLLGTGIALFLLAAVWLFPGRETSRKFLRSFAILAAIVIPTGLANLQPSSFDLTENRKYSFSPTIRAALEKLDHRLVVTVHLDPGDGRRQDLEKELLLKLRRAVPELEIDYRESGDDNRFKTSGDQQYGLLEFAYHGRHDQSYSSSPEEILPLIFRLACIDSPPTHPETADYPGYPLVASARGCAFWFYLILPLAYLAGGLRARRGRWL